MAQAHIVYHRNQTPNRGLAAAGILLIKVLLLIPHLWIIGILQELAYAVGYIGYFVVAFTGRMPDGISSLITVWLRWTARAYGWLVSISDVYPPFEIEPAGYGIDVRTPRNEEPSQGWAVAGIFFLKVLAAIPHLVVLAFVEAAAVLVAWIGYVIIVFSGRFPKGMQDFIAGTIQWYVRVMAWILGLTDQYPPFSLAVSPSE